MRQGVFEAPIVGLLFWPFCLGHALAKSQKRFRCPCQMVMTLMEPRFAAKCSPMFAL